MPRWFAWIWVFLVGLAWWNRAAQTADENQVGSHALAAVTLARFAAFAAEAGYYVLGWRSVGKRLRFGWFFAWVVTLSMLDLMAETLRVVAIRHPHSAPLLAPLAGVGLVRSMAGSGGLKSALGSLGILTVARIALNAWLQARDVGSRVWKALLFVLCTWLATRLAIGWTVDLVRGMSPLP